MKKLLSVFSVFTLSGISSINVISCGNATKTLTMQEQENDIVKAINLENKNKKGNNIKVSDILTWSKHQYKNINKSTIQFTYDVLLKQNVISFLTKNYRITEVKGEFNIDTNNNVKEITYNPIYSPGNYDNVIHNDKALFGTENNFTLIMGDWNDFSERVFFEGANETFKDEGIYNKNIYLTDNQWNKIIKRIFIRYSEYNVCINIIRDKSGNFKIGYTNYTEGSKYNFPSLGVFTFSLFAFQSSNYVFNNDVLGTDNKNLILNKDILMELNDIYNSYKNNEVYGKTNWTVNSISNLLKTNKFSYDAVNLNYKIISQLLINLFNTDKSYYEIQDLLNNKNISNVYKGIDFTFDKNNNYLENKLFSASYSNNKDNAIRYVKDNYDLKQLLSTFSSGKGYDVQYINSEGISQDKYVVYNNQKSFNDYKNIKDDVKKYFNSNGPKHKEILDIRNFDIDNKWEVTYKNKKGLQVIIYQYDSSNATFKEFK